MSADFTGGAANGSIGQSPLASQGSGTDGPSTPGTLEPLPEQTTVPESRRSPRREWKPPLETTDVVGVMEAIEGKIELT